MKVHHLNCGSLCPVGGRHLPSLVPSTAVCHCLLIETSKRLVLVDTGLGLQDVEHPSSLDVMNYILNAKRDSSLTAFEQIKAMGYSPRDVSDIIVTHLDLDHAGGIPDFRSARVHVSGAELNRAWSRPSWKDRSRYRAQHLSEETKWRTFSVDDGENWNGFECARELADLPPEILLVRLPGHSQGHFGIAVQSGSSWLLHAGDSYYSREGLDPRGRVPLALNLFDRVAHMDARQAKETRSRLARLAKKSNIKVFCSHDPLEYDNLKAAAGEA